MAKVGAKVEPPPCGRALDGRTLFGRHVTLLRVSAREQARDLYKSFSCSEQVESLWSYMGYGPFTSLRAFETWLEGCEESRDPLYLVIVPRDGGTPAGMASYLRIEPQHGVAEIGNIWFAPELQKTRAATEALFLMMRHVFDELGYRRLEWKCDSLNAPSRAAADRLGFAFEGIFRQHMVIKGRNRDTAWYAIVDREWPQIRTRFRTWLADDNFDRNGRQKQSLSAL